jgi:putative Holliday junction resolvase
VSGPGRLLGVDPGTVRIGLAISDRDRRLASPLDTYRRRTAEQDAKYFQALVKQEEIVAIVVGLPLHTDGREGAKAAEARQLGDWLARTTGLAVAYHDERFSTVFAESELWSAGLTHKQRKERRDRVAAQLILQAYLDAQSAV